MKPGQEARRSERSHCRGSRDEQRDPRHPTEGAPELPSRSQRDELDAILVGNDLDLLTRTEVESLADRAGDHDLELGGNGDLLHGVSIDRVRVVRYHDRCPGASGVRLMEEFRGAGATRWPLRVRQTPTAISRFPDTRA